MMIKVGQRMRKKPALGMVYTSQNGDGAWSMIVVVTVVVSSYDISMIYSHSSG